MIVLLFLVDDEVMCWDLVFYYNEVIWFDVFIGKVVKVFYEEGLFDNILIIVMVDNGWFFLWVKIWFYDSGMWMLFVVYWLVKIMEVNYGRREGLISVIDIVLIILEVVGVMLLKMF